MDKQKYLQAVNECKNLNVIFQLTDKCVLSCRYCFARGAHGAKAPEFPTDLLEKAISQAFLTQHESVSFEWTGGEAFLMGIDFFKKVSELQKKHATKPFHNAVQTSGYLLDKELIDYLLDNGFGLSVTIDGPEEIHDANRPAQDGKASFKKVLETFNYIKKKTGRCGFISTITKNNLGHEKEMLDYFRTLGTYSFHSNPYIYFDRNIVKDKSIALDNKDYARYFIAQFNEWYSGEKLTPIPYTIDYFMSCISSKNKSNHTLCSFGGRCLTNFIAITPDGDCFNCPKFSGHANMCIGNLNETDLHALLDPDRNKKMAQLIEQRLCAVKQCENENCEFAYICNGGCPYYSYIAGGGKDISAKDGMCEGKLMVLNYMKDILSRIIPEKTV